MSITVKFGTRSAEIDEADASYIGDILANESLMDMLHTPEASRIEAIIDGTTVETSHPVHSGDKVVLTTRANAKG